VGPGQSAGRPGSLSGDRLAWPELTAALDWLPLACLLLAADGTALAVSQAWSALSGLAAEDSRADGWASAVEPLDRGVLRARLRDAAAAGQAGYADARLAGPPAGRWSRWWWRPGPAGRLIVCVADLGDSPDRDDQWQHDRRTPGRLVRRSELVNLVGRALRRSSHHGGHVAVIAIRLHGIAADPGSGAEPAGDLLRAAAERASAAAGPASVAARVAPSEFVILLDGLRAPGDAGIIASGVRDAVSQPLEADGTPVQVTVVTGVAVADGSSRSAEELIEKASSAVQLDSHADKADPPDQRPAADPAGYTWSDLAGMLVHRLFAIGLALQSASALADGPVAASLQQALDQLDSIIQDTQTAVFESQAPQHRHDGEDQ
jgi:GGDEF domain-containing protein